MDDFVTVMEAALNLGVSPDTIRRWEKNGLIKATRSNRNFRLFNMQEVERLHRKIFGTHTTNNYQILRSPEKRPYTVIELFAGAGGTALGLEHAGLQHKLLVERDLDCVETLRKNGQHWNVVSQDVAEVSFSGIEADVVQGGFPCQAFSYAGRKWGLRTRGAHCFSNPPGV